MDNHPDVPPDLMRVLRESQADIEAGRIEDANEVRADLQARLDRMRQPASRTGTGR